MLPGAVALGDLVRAATAATASVAVADPHPASGRPGADSFPPALAVAARAQETGGVPNYGRRATEWETLHDDGVVVIQVASAEALLAMKLRANRPGRDDTDIAKLMAICDIRTLDAAEELYEDFYSGEALADRAVRMVTRILEVGLPPTPVRPPAPELG